jgi:hypothetical protein
MLTQAIFVEASVSSEPSELRSTVSNRYPAAARVLMLVASLFIGCDKIFDGQ